VLLLVGHGLRVHGGLDRHSTQNNTFQVRQQAAANSCNGRHPWPEPAHHSCLALMLFPSSLAHARTHSHTHTHTYTHTHTRARTHARSHAPTHAPTHARAHAHTPRCQDVKFAVSSDVLPCGTRVPAGAMVLYSAYAINRMQEFWGPDADKFR
jgi:hypothetical protein